MRNIYTCRYIDIDMDMDIDTDIYVCVHKHTHIYIYMSCVKILPTYIHTYMHAYIYTYIHEGGPLGYVTLFYQGALESRILNPERGLGFRGLGV